MNRLSQFTKSLSYAMRGLKYAVRNEKNFQNELAAAILVIVAMLYFHVTRAEMIVLFIIIMAVLIMELVNTILERVVDILKPRVVLWDLIHLIFMPQNKGSINVF